MSDADWGAVIVIAFVVIIVLWVIKGPSEKDLEKREREKEHEIRMQELQQKEEQLRSRSRAGKVVKAKRV